MILLIKLVHTLIFFVLSGSLFFVLYSGVVNRLSRWTSTAIGLLVLETVALLANGWKCPLSSLMERYEGNKGGTMDIFLPKWLEGRVFGICTPLYGISLGIVTLRVVQNRRRSVQRTFRGASHAKHELYPSSWYR